MQIQDKKISSGHLSKNSTPCKGVSAKATDSMNLNDDSIKNDGKLCPVDTESGESDDERKLDKLLKALAEREKRSRHDSDDDSKERKRNKAPLKSPSLQAYCDRLAQVMKRCGAEGSTLIVGMSRAEGEDDDYNEDEEIDEAVATEAQVATLRHVLMTKRRTARFQTARAFATCGQKSDFFISFSTHTGGTIVAGVPGEVRKAMRQTGLPQRFDSLLALTYHLNHYDEWMHDNDVSDECGAALRCLAAAWKDLLAHDDAALGIDAEFTRPGTEALVTAIADTAKSLDYAFPWR